MKATHKRHHTPPHTTCQRKRLAEGPVAAVDECECGMLQLHVGAFTLRLTPRALSDLVGTLGLAVAERAAHAAAGDSAPGLAFTRPKRGEA